MMRDEGVIKYVGHWQPGPAVSTPLMAPLMAGRDRLYDAGLVGAYPDGIGYGNVSVRLPTGGFLISGTQTGALPQTGPEHYSLVDQWDIAANRLHCTGPIKASSESLTHGALYDHDPAIGAIAHGHHPDLWAYYRDRLPTTCPSVPYGTPAMAAEMIRLFHDTDLPQRRVLVMAGHEDGVLAFGPTVAAAVQGLLDLQQQFQKSLQTLNSPEGQGYG
ncbi:MAG: class II aldolase/adducin family protein [Cyanobacteria bacterium]|nr:class II aldolase/adducin family protein [Cyanobacteriota bacterium]